MIMLSRIKPSKIICYGKPFDEMKGDIIEVDYAKTNNLQKSNCDLYIKTFYGYVDNTYRKAAAPPADKAPAILNRNRLGRLKMKLLKDF